MKKVLFFHPDLRGGGAEKVLVDLVNNLDSTKYNITLYTIFEEGVNRKNLKPEIHQKFLFKKVFRGYSVLQSFFSPAFLYRFFIKKQYDIVVAYLEGVPTRIISGCKDKNAKKIGWVHTKLSEAPLSRVFKGKKEMTDVYNLYDKVVCVSEVAKESLLDYLEIDPKKVTVIYNTLDVRSVLHRSLERSMVIQPDEGQVNICTVGRLTEVKGFERLLHVLSRLHEQSFNFKMHFMGDGHLLGYLQAIVQKAKMEAVVHFMGFTENPYPHVKAADLFVCSSFTEGYSTAVTEAILLEVPVITTLCPGMNEILGNGEYGLIVENNEEAIYLGLHNLLSNSDLLASYKLKAIERKSQFMEKSKCEDVENLFDTI